jgi:predicted nucleotidyltransferase component of viral defense system
MALTAPQTIECFHLAFLAVLRTRLDEGRYVLKGGANLRYFFSSVRYSEDIDLDTSDIEGWKLEDQVDKALSSDALRIVLRAVGVSVLTDEITKPKQTDTTRRWKIPVAAAGLSQPVRTKVEFSARNGERRFALETVPNEIVRPYAMRPPSVQHYLLAPATEQKVLALAGRPETQARDVFDLDLLLGRASLEEGAVAKEIRQKAAEACVGLPFQAFADQVRPFLDPPVAALYDEPAWSQMQDHVVSELLR